MADPEGAADLSIVETPSYALAVVLLFFLTITFVADFALKGTRGFLERRSKKGLLAAHDAMSTELLLLGFASLILAAFSNKISTICVRDVDQRWNLLHNVNGCPCCLQHTAHVSSCFLASRGCGPEFCNCGGKNPSCVLEEDPAEAEQCLGPQQLEFEACSNRPGYQPVTSALALEEMHLFIFFLAIVHIVTGVVVYLLAVLRLRSWRRFQKEDDRHAAAVLQALDQHADLLFEVDACGHMFTEDSQGQLHAVDPGMAVSLATSVVFERGSCEDSDDSFREREAQLSKGHGTNRNAWQRLMSLHRQQQRDEEAGGSLGGLQGEGSPPRLQQVHRQPSADYRRSGSSETTPEDSRLAIFLDSEPRSGTVAELLPYGRESAPARAAGPLPGAGGRPERQASLQIGAHRKPPPARLASALQAGSRRHKGGMERAAHKLKTRSSALFASRRLGPTMQSDAQHEASTAQADGEKSSSLRPPGANGLSDAGTNGSPKPVLNRGALTLPKEISVARSTKWMGRQHVLARKRDHVVEWFKCILLQFQVLWLQVHIITHEDFSIMRASFILTHRLGREFNFIHYVRESMDDDFSKVVGVSVVMWLIVLVCVLISGPIGWALSWFVAVGWLLTLVVNGKLMRIVRHATRGGVVHKLAPNAFWFKKPWLLLPVIKALLFLNGFVFTSLIYFAIILGPQSCIFQQTHMLTASLPIPWWAIFIVTIYTSGSLSLITLPLYSLAVQMGSDHKHHLVQPHHKHKVQEAAAEKASKEAKQALETAKTSLT